MVVVAVIAAVLLLGFLGFRMLTGGGSDALVAERKHDWESRLSLEQEQALLAGLTVWRDSGHSLYLNHDIGGIYVYEPKMIVSLYAMADAFTKQSFASGEGQSQAIATWVDAFCAEGRGVLKIAQPWFVEGTAGMDKLQFSRFTSGLASNGETSGSNYQGSGDNEDFGYVYVTVRASETSPTNSYFVDLGKIVAAVAGSTHPEDAAKDALRAAVKQEPGSGGLWLRNPDAAELRAADELINSSRVRARNADGSYA